MDAPTPRGVTGAQETRGSRAAAPAGRRGARRRGPLLLILLVVAAALGAGVWWFLRVDTGSAAQLATVPVAKGDLEDAVTALGTLQPRDYVDVGTQVSGQLRKIHVEIGSDVKQGDLLAEIDPTVYQSRVEGDKAQLRNYQAQLSERQAQRRLAEQQFQRQAGLLRANATSQEAYQSAEAALKVADAQIESLKAQIAQTESTLRGNEANLGYTKIYAPMAGTVVSITARQGQTLNANQQAPIILRIADLDTMTVWTQVSEADVSRLEVGMEAYFTTLGHPDRRWTGKLRQVLPTPEVVNNVVLYNALFDVENPEHVLKTQMTAQVFFVRAAARDALTVPLAALMQGEGRRQRGAQPGAPPAGSRGRVRVVVGDRIEERAVTIGVRNRIAAEIQAGLAEGELVVIGTRQPERAAPQGPVRRPRI